MVIVLVHGYEYSPGIQYRFRCTRLNSQTERLTAALEETQTVLSRSYDDKGDIDKTRFTPSVEKQLGRNLEHCAHGKENSSILSIA